MAEDLAFIAGESFKVMMERPERDPNWLAIHPRGWVRATRPSFPLLSKGPRGACDGWASQRGPPVSFDALKTHGYMLTWPEYAAELMAETSAAPQVCVADAAILGG